LPDLEKHVPALKSAPRFPLPPSRLAPKSTQDLPTAPVSPPGPAVVRGGRVRLLVAACAGVCAAACGPMVDRAPFPYRADSLSPGDLLGPFEGIVVDAETDRPLGGAVVSGSWAFERGVGLAGPAGASEVVTETGADGRYRLPALGSLPSGASTRVRRFTLIVYQKGYVGWRSDRRFPTGEARRDFSQRGNKVRLEKWRDGMAHSQHLVFLGGGATIKTAAQAEVQAAVFELEGRTPLAGGKTEGPTAPTAKTLLDATPLLDEDELRAATGYAGEFDIDRLADLPRTEFYDSRHFKARGQTEKFDVGLRVWHLGEAGADAQFRKLLGQLPNATVVDELGDTSLRARQGDLLGMAFLERQRGVVVALTCGIGQCSEPAVLTRIAKLIEGHLGDLVPAPPAAPETPSVPPVPEPPAAPPEPTPTPPAGGGTP
jgi:hypothetical protein